MEPHDVHAPELRRRERLFQPAAPGNARRRRRSPAGIAGRRRGRHGARAFHALPAFDNYLRRTYPVEIYNRGGGTLAWTAHASEPWVVLSKSAGKTADEERITVGIDWEKAPRGTRCRPQIVFRAGEQSEKVLVSLFNPTAPSRAELPRHLRREQRLRLDPRRRLPPRP